MNHAATLDEQSVRAILSWAAERQSSIAASILSDGQWCNLRSHLVQYDPDANVLKIHYPILTDGSVQPEITAGTELGISLRRGHKKCVFVCRVLMRQTEIGPDDRGMDCLLVRSPQQMRELQRRAYQRVIIPEDRFIAVRLWQGGLPSQTDPEPQCPEPQSSALPPTWPICSGRLANVSLGGMLVDIRCDQNPRMGVGEIVGVEITHQPSRPPLAAEAQYRHCVMTGPGRMGLGLQFLGLEHNLPNHTSIHDLAEFVRHLRTSGSHPARED